MSSVGKYKRTLETIEKMRKSHLGKKHTFEQTEKIRKSLIGRNVSKETRLKISNSLKNDKNFNWKKIPTYGIVHYWLRTNFGKPNKCEDTNCKKISFTFDWALIHGEKYIRNRNNFIRLCRSCHKIYDKKY